MNNLSEWAKSVSVSLHDSFYRCFLRNPEPTDVMDTFETSIGTIMICNGQVFAMVNDDGVVTCILDMGYDTVPYFNPVTHRVE